MSDNCLCNSLYRYIDQTVTIFTTSGGISGSGYTGVLAAVNDNCVKLITDIGAAPNCPLGSTCGCAPAVNNFGSRYYGNNNGCGSCCNRWLGSVTEIPICKIASFTHNAI
ncbi:MAG: hypothetical protein IJ736_16260 [Firmicutes bacterium]|nr:hypothetical protein [Bacillota bacterium]